MTEAVPAGSAPSDDPANRGLTRVSPNVVERIAAYACHRLENVVSTHTHPDLERAPLARARADINGRHARLAVTVGVRYAVSMRTAAAQIREAVIADVERLCGMRVLGVDVEAQPVNLAVRSRVR